MNKIRLRISRKKIEYTENKFGERYQKVDNMTRLMTINDDVIGELENFKYLG